MFPKAGVGTGMQLKVISRDEHRIEASEVPEMIHLCSVEERQPS
jgi:hypothetical protein